MDQKQAQDFGDFQEINKESSKKEEKQDQTVVTRVRTPKGKELIGIIVQRLGGNRMDVKTTDGKIRNCRVPGRYRRRLWLRPKNIIIIIPWEYDDTKGDVIYKYPPAAVYQLRKLGVLDSLNDEF